MLVGVGPDELTTAFSAYGGAAEMVEPLGQRIPLIPPIGEAYVAGRRPRRRRALAGQGATRRTPSSSSSTAPAWPRSSAAERGVSFLGGDGPREYEQLRAALREYGDR